MDSAWVEHLAVQYGSALRRYLYSHTGSVQDADDLYQDIFLACFEHRNSFDPARCSEQAWLFVIARNRLISFYRSKKQQVSLESLAEQGVDFADNVSTAAMELVDCRETLAGALLKLDERSRTVLILRFFGGRSGREIADELGISEGNVRVLQARALGRLLELLADCRD